MVTNPQTPVPHQDDERVSNVMVFTRETMVWGDVVTKVSLKVSLWLRSQAIPQFVHLYNANLMRLSATGATKPISHPQLFVPSTQILAFHLKPPAAEPLDYDANEPMRKMEPVSVVVGQFCFNGSLRMSSQTNVERFLEVSKEVFASLYDVTILCPIIPGFAPFKVPFTLVRENEVLFATKNSG